MSDVKIESLIPEKVEIAPYHNIIDGKMDDSTSGEVLQDIEFARGNMIKTIEIAMDAMESLSRLADDSGHPRAYEVLNAMVRESISANKTLMEVHKDKIKQKDSAPAATQNNAIFVGSTDQLLDFLKKNVQ